MDISGQQTILLIKGKSGYLLSKNPIHGKMDVQDKEIALVKQFFRINHVEPKTLPNSGIIKDKTGGIKQFYCFPVNQRLPLIQNYPGLI